MGVAGGQADLDVVGDVDGLDALELQAGGLDLLAQGVDALAGPDLARGDVEERADDAGAARDLGDLLKGDLLGLGSVPTETKLHVLGSLSLARG